MLRPAAAPAHRPAVVLLASLLLVGSTSVVRGQATRDPLSRQRSPSQQTSKLGEAAQAFRPLTQPQREELQRARFVSPEVLEAAIDPATYVLGPHDVLALMIMVGEVRLERLPVLPEGVVLVPNVGAVVAAGRTLAAFRAALRQALSEHYRDFELFCYLAEARQFRVYVTGEVQMPGTMVARPYERVSDLIERAGGFTQVASRRAIEVRDAQGSSRARVDLDAYYRRGDLQANPQLAAGQVVFVPARRYEVEVLGEVAQPGTYELRRGDTLQDLLELAGGTTPQADLSQVSVDAINAHGEVRVQSYDLRNGSPRLDDVVRISVLSSLLGKRRAFAIMPDNTQHVLYLSPSGTLLDLVRRVAQLEPDADLAHARLASHDGNGEMTRIPVDIGRVLRGEEDHPLQDGDVLSVPRVKGHVYVSGLV
ncbi:MAG: SLBB domain-containing protein, partial [Candidatus Krumholzibacteriia bacterium]